MDIRYAIHPDHLKSLDTDATRRHFLVERVFEEDKVNLVYSHIDRIIVGGVHPVRETLPLEVTKPSGWSIFFKEGKWGLSISALKALLLLMEQSTRWQSGNAFTSGWAARRYLSRAATGKILRNSTSTALLPTRLTLWSKYRRTMPRKSSSVPRKRQT